MTGIAVIPSELSASLVAKLAGRVHNRAGRDELQFHWWQDPCLLPVRWDGAVRLLKWGCKDRRARIPFGGWLDRGHVEAGALGHARPDEAVILANLGFHRGTWFVIAEGVRAVVLPDAPAGPVVYMLAEPASNYYRNMTGQSPTMPV